MSELDKMLLRLAAEPAPDAVALLDEAVLSGMAMRHERQIGRRVLAVAGGVAVLVGFGGATIPAGQGSAEPLLGIPAAAPSHLLVD